MARIAKRKLSHDHLTQLYDQLHSTLGALNKKQTNLFMTELLGPEEKIMLAKRLAVIVMLNENYSLYRTANTLSISSATARTIKLKLKQNKYKHLVTMLTKNKKDYLSILDTIDSILQLGGILPRYGNAGRYTRNFTKNLSID